MKIKSKIMIYFLVFTMVFTSIGTVIGTIPMTMYAQPTSSFSGKGEGTSENPYVITSPNELDEIRNNLSGYYILGNDIDLSSISEWTPIGTEEEPFKGTLDGQGYSINNLTITSDNLDVVGLFGYCDRDTVSLRNINVLNINIVTLVVEIIYCISTLK